jgi:hypothetical protein
MLAARHCMKALDFIEAGVPRDRGLFAVGVAAHAVLQGLAGMPGGADPHTVAQAVAEHLTTKGRSFDGVPEPPLDPGAVIEGVGLALAWHGEHPIAPGAKAERGVAVDRRWHLVEYGSSAAHYRAIYDLVWSETVDVDEDQEGEGLETAVCLDYKSSWQADESDLDSVQMRGQAVLAALAYPNADAVRLEIGALRTRKLYAKTIVLDEAGRAELAKWTRDLELAIAAADARGADGKRIATPGAGCDGCPYITRCDAAHAWMRGSLLDGLDDELARRRAVGTRLAVAEAMAAELKQHARRLTEEAPIEIDRGVVGWLPKDERVPRDEAWRAIAHRWFQVSEDQAGVWDAEHGEVLGLLRALDPGVTSITSLAQALAPFDRGDKAWKERRGALMDELITTSTAPKFGVFRQSKGTP